MVTMQAHVTTPCLGVVCSRRPPGRTKRRAASATLVAMERNTRQRTAIREALRQAHRPLLPQEVLAAAQAGVPGLGLATVYRNLKALVEEGELQPVALPGENPRFEMAGRHHHHHFQCRNCQRVFDVHACPGDLSRLAPPGFTVQDHELTLYGRCGECSAAAG
jgi:Fur family transcriptional regulator, ferric uptake regulator